MLRAKLFVFLRLYCHGLFDQGFKAELAAAYADRRGASRGASGQLALAIGLQAHTGVSDEVIEATAIDRRWQLVLDCMRAEKPPFPRDPGELRQRLIERDLDRRLVERTVKLGAGRVEDTFNFDGTALRNALGVVAVLQGWGQATRPAVMVVPARVPQRRRAPRRQVGPGGLVVAELDRGRDQPEVHQPEIDRGLADLKALGEPLYKLRCGLERLVHDPGTHHMVGHEQCRREPVRLDFLPIGRQARDVVTEVHPHIRVNDYRTSPVQMEVTEFVGDRKPLARTTMALIHPDDDPVGLAHEHA